VSVKNQTANEDYRPGAVGGPAVGRGLPYWGAAEN